MTTTDVGEPSARTIAEVLAQSGRSFSFEFFPPKTDDGEIALWNAIRDLEPLNPTFASVTYGAGGSTRARTMRLTSRIQSETSIMPMAHLTCVGAAVGELEITIEAYEAFGVRNLLALRGDAPTGVGTEWVAPEGGLAHADDLVRLVTANSDICVGVAAFPEGHPEAPSLDHDSKVLAAKQDAGAQFAITQFFFRAQDYFALIERAARDGVDIPIIPGIMPVTSLAQIERFAVLSGAAFPRNLAARFDALSDDADGVRALGVELGTQLAAELLAGGAPGLHFYTLNRSTATRDIYVGLGLGPSMPAGSAESMT